MIIYQKYITRQDLRSNLNIAYLFGDNLERRGYGGQAKEMRGEPNAFGIITKRNPNMDLDAFFDNSDFDSVKSIIDKSFEVLASTYKIIIIPMDGLGTGLAMLDTKAPKIFNYIL